MQLNINRIMILNVSEEKENNWELKKNTQTKWSDVKIISIFI